MNHKSLPKGIPVRFSLARKWSKEEAAPGLDPGTAMPIRVTNTAVWSNCLSA
jgi:hypothetical protein